MIEHQPMAKGPQTLYCELWYPPTAETVRIQSTYWVMLDLCPHNGLQNLCLYASWYKQKKLCHWFENWSIVLQCAVIYSNTCHTSTISQHMVIPIQWRALISTLPGHFPAPPVHVRVNPFPSLFQKASSFFQGWTRWQTGQVRGKVWVLGHCSLCSQIYFSTKGIGGTSTTFPFEGPFSTASPLESLSLLVSSCGWKGWRCDDWCWMNIGGRKYSSWNSFLWQLPCWHTWSSKSLWSAQLLSWPWRQTCWWTQN